MFNKALRAYDACADFRKKRRRFLRFAYGRQWDDPVYDPYSKTVMTEGELASRNGNTPLTNNLIRQIVKTVVGRYRNIYCSNRREDPLELVRRVNRLDELDARNLEEFLVSGVAVQKISLRYDSENRAYPFVENINPARFFFSSSEDPRGFDVDFVGVCHDWSPGKLLRRFAGGDIARAESLKKVYSEAFSGNQYSQSAPFSISTCSFTTAPAGKCRVIEIWALENSEIIRVLDPSSGLYSEHPVSYLPEIEKTNALRRDSGDTELKVRYDCRAQWVRYFYAFNGKLLSRDTDPSPFGSHPFVFKLYPLTDGEIHPFVEDIVDQQRCINRMISTIDNIMAASAKGLLLYPVNLKPDNLSWDSIAQRWTRTGGIVPYVARPGFPVPQQITSSGLDAGASRMLDIQMNMMKNVSGVTDALMGKSAPSSGIDRFEAEIRNATIALTDILDSYADLISLRDQKLLKSINYEPTK